MQQRFEAIRPLLDSEVAGVLQKFGRHPAMKTLLNYTFPDKKEEEIKAILNRCNSIRDFQEHIFYHTVKKTLKNSAESVTSSGFENLEPNKPYLFISNHRDIVLDTSILNSILFEKGLLMTASAIGDNLISKPFLKAIAQLNRNFLIRRNLGVREKLESAKLTSQYIRWSITGANRSIWIAQREGRTKDGDDKTQHSVLKMLSLASEKENISDYLKKLQIIPVAISYEYDPTDVLKMPELMARLYNLNYVKTDNEDFNNIINGALGQKKNIHIGLGELTETTFLKLQKESATTNRFVQNLAVEIDLSIYKNYKLWPSNYIAYDLRYDTDVNKNNYTTAELRAFKKRINRRVDVNNSLALDNFLDMYANPVVNKNKFT